MPKSTFVLPDKIPWYRYLGPWPLRPFIVFIFGWYFYLVTATGQYMGQGSAEASQWLEGALSLAIPAAAVMAGITYLGRRWQSRHGVHLGSYLLFTFLAAGGGLGFRFAVGAIPSEPFAEPLPILVGLFRTVVLLTFISATAGILTTRLQQQVNATNAALQLVRNQQVIMLEADESARRQVSALLHDRVQAGLIAACLELQVIANTELGDKNNSLQGVIERLETLRTLDVRRAARALSPDLQDIDLQSALEELAAQYEPGMGTTIRVAPSLDSRRTDFGDEFLLAIYRIVEQALLNAATHGRANHAEVTVTDGSSHVEIRVSDDGVGLSSHPGQGAGSAILTTWSRLFDGQWSLSAGPTGGAQMTASLRNPQVKSKTLSQM